MSDRTKRERGRASWSEVAEEAETEAAEGEQDRSPEQEAETAVEAELSEQLDALQSQLGGLNDRYLRLAAEFQNYRRRVESEMSETWGRAQADLLRRFLDVLDDLQRVAAIEADDKVHVQSIVDGVDLVERKLVRAIKDAGVEILNPAGQRFDPSTMEAVMTVPTESEQEDEHVHQVFQDGYLLKGHLIRPSRVSVKKHA